ncbi:MAG: hypothetical protein LBJ47_02160 [Tannerella sp.]|nr:hypothetical protein [Tannerella sp.]
MAYQTTVRLPPVDLYFTRDIFFSVIANEVKQSRHRPRSPDGHQATACSWIASFLAMTAGRKNAITMKAMPREV